MSRILPVPGLSPRETLKSKRGLEPTRRILSPELPLLP
jgi:hypothetical protein